MTRTLIILRHAKSDWDQSCSDYDRPLNKRGRRDAPSIGTWLGAQSVQPERVLSSPARRTRETVEAVSTAAGIAPAAIEWDERIYLASLDQLLTLLGERADDPACIMLVGHNPGLEDLLLYLARDPIPRGRNGKLLTTATLARLVVDSDWQHLARGCASLETIVRPRDLTDR